MSQKIRFKCTQVVDDGFKKTVSLEIVEGCTENQVLSEDDDQYGEVRINIDKKSNMYNLFKPLVEYYLTFEEAAITAVESESDPTEL